MIEQGKNRVLTSIPRFAEILCSHIEMSIHARLPCRALSDRHAHQALPKQPKMEGLCIFLEPSQNNTSLDRVGVRNISKNRLRKIPFIKYSNFKLQLAPI